MLTAAFANYIKSLQSKKARLLHGHFVVEGEKGVMELLRSKLGVVHVLALQEWLTENQHLLPTLANIVPLKQRDLERVSGLTSPQPVMAVASLPKQHHQPSQNLLLYLDGISDPGNLGTIIRTADWYGLSAICCSPDTADCYSPKVVQATMGSLFRMQISYIPFQSVQKHTKQVFGALLQGQPPASVNFEPGSVLIVGSEASGIRPETASYITAPVCIPRLGHAESLNAAVATAILLDRFLGG